MKSTSIDIPSRVVALAWLGAVGCRVFWLGAWRSAGDLSQPTAGGIGGAQFLQINHVVLAEIKGTLGIASPFETSEFLPPGKHPPQKLIRCPDKIARIVLAQ